MKYDPPNERQLQIMERNRIGPEGFAVEHESEGCIVLLNYKTRDRIMVLQGDKPWDSY